MAKPRMYDSFEKTGANLSGGFEFNIELLESLAKSVPQGTWMWKEFAEKYFNDKDEEVHIRQNWELVSKQETETTIGYEQLLPHNWFEPDKTLLLYQYFAAVSPETILRLIKRIRELENDHSG